MTSRILGYVCMTLLLCTLNANAVGKRPIDSDRPDDPYVSDLVDIGVPLGGVDVRIYNPETDSFDDTYIAGPRYTHFGKVDEFLFPTFKNGMRTEYLVQDTHSLGTSSNQSYDVVDIQNPLPNGSVFSSVPSDSTILRHAYAEGVFPIKMGSGMIHRNRIIARPQMYTFVLHTSRNNITLSQRDENGHAYLVNLSLYGGVDFPEANNAELRLGNKMQAVFADTDGNGEDDTLAIEYYGKIYVWNITNFLWHDDYKYIENYVQSYTIDKMNFATDSSSDYVASLSVGKVHPEKKGEQLIYLYAYKYISEQRYPSNSRMNVLKVISLGSTGYRTIFSMDNVGINSLIEQYRGKDFGEANYTTATVTNFSNTDKPQIALGGVYYQLRGSFGDYTYQTISVLELSNVGNDELVVSDIPSVFKWSTDLSVSTMYKQNSIAAADMIGLGQDYLAFSNQIFAYDPSADSKMTSIKTVNTGSYSEVYMEWVSGNFADDYNEFLYVDDEARLKTIDGSDLNYRAEGEELILVHVNRDYGKYSLRRYELFDIDSGIFDDLMDNGSIVRSSVGVGPDDYLSPILHYTPVKTINSGYNYDFPGLYAGNTDYDLGTAEYADIHTVRISPPILNTAIETVPYYSAIANEQRSTVSVAYTTDSVAIEGYEYRNGFGASISAEFGGDVGPGFKIGFESAFSKSTYSGQGIVTAGGVGFTAHSGLNMLVFDFIPMDVFTYTITGTPNIPGGALVGDPIEFNVIREPIRFSTSHRDWSAAMDNLGNPFSSYDHVFDGELGVPSSYLNKSELQVQYPYRYPDSNYQMGVSRSMGTRLSITETTGRAYEDITSKAHDFDFTFGLSYSAKIAKFETSSTYSHGFTNSVYKYTATMISASGEIDGFPQAESDKFTPYTVGSYMAEVTSENEPQYLKVGYYLK
ncbi:hypothetical protein GCM10007978_05340 [Shewanella hanedai]|uniref:Insecticide toxin TcdB middle/N-terminal domain-containing protein n=1 Tax=Shewanella hanedai TaxID=25 RepID=A0A553JTN3_SHEHA|nr:hypothetical protein [Shewanella hanedai]TRY15817.1 hypothetical protein FN961_02200 [Shewanella hanedai]GGI70296.1 hypothetical protein GCM10007978_05340 [Shewanella hanedai]